MCVDVANPQESLSLMTNLLTPRTTATAVRETTRSHTDGSLRRSGRPNQDISSLMHDTSSKSSRQ